MPSFPKNKYGAVRTADGFPSLLERSVYQLLLLRQCAGEISDLKRYPSVKLTKRIIWKVDFEFVVVATGERRFAEAKGMMTAECSLKLRLWRDGFGPGPLEWWKGHHARPTLTEVIYPEPRSPESRQTGPASAEANELPPDPAQGHSEGSNE